MTGPAIGHRGYIDNSRGSYGYLPHATPTPAIPSHDGLPYWRKLEREGIDIADKYVRFKIRICIMQSARTNLTKIPLLVKQKVTVRDTFPKYSTRQDIRIRPIPIQLRATASKTDTFKIHVTSLRTDMIQSSTIPLTLAHRNRLDLRPRIDVYSSKDDDLILQFA